MLRKAHQKSRYKTLDSNLVLASNFSTKYNRINLGWNWKIFRKLPILLLQITTALSVKIRVNNYSKTTTQLKYPNKLWIPTRLLERSKSIMWAHQMTPTSDPTHFASKLVNLFGKIIWQLKHPRITVHQRQWSTSISCSLRTYSSPTWTISKTQTPIPTSSTSQPNQKVKLIAISKISSYLQ